MALIPRFHLSRGLREAGVRVWRGVQAPLVLAVLVYGTGWMALETVVSAGCPGSQIETTKLQMDRVAQYVEIYSLRKGVPEDQDGFVDVFPEGLPTDSWGNQYLYVPPSRPGDDFDLVSLGADGRVGGLYQDADLWYSERWR